VKRQVIRDGEFKNLELESEHVTEIEYSPGRAKGTYRLIMLRKNIVVSKGQIRLEPETRYFFYITNVPKKQMSATGVVRQSSARCHQENLIEQLKNGVQATRMPVAEFKANWAYLVIGALAWNLKAWTALVLPERFGACWLIDMKFRTFLDEVILVPTQILRSGRRLIYRVLSINRWTPLLLDATRYLRGLRPA
ncbi:MAG: transposase, partial [Acidobacteriota bacterium]